jgi:hypothetical protein
VEASSAATIAYSQAATQLVVQNLRESNCASSGSPSSASLQNYWYSIAGALEEHRPGGLPGIDLNRMTGKQLLEMHMGSANDQTPLRHILGTPCCQLCGSTLRPGTCDATARIQSITRKERKRQPKRKSKRKPQDNIMDVDNDGVLSDPYEWMILAATSKGLKNQLIIKCRICGMANKAPGLFRKENQGAENSADTEKRPVKKAIRPPKVACATRTEIETGRDFVPLGPATILLSDKKKRKRSNNKPVSQLHDFLNTLND